MTGKGVDLVQQGFDCVLRIGPLANTELIARPLGVLPMCNLAAHGTPRTLAELSQHRINEDSHR